MHLSDKTFPSNGQMFVGVLSEGAYLSSSYTGFKPGTTASIKATPLLRTASKDLKALSIDKRSCRLKSEPLPGSSFAELDSTQHGVTKFFLAH